MVQDLFDKTQRGLDSGIVVGLDSSRRPDKEWCYCYCYCAQVGRQAAQAPDRGP